MLNDSTAVIDGADLVHRADLPPSWRALGGVARAALLALGSRRVDGSIEVTESGRTRLLGSGEPVAYVEVRDRRAYSALALSGSVGLGASYVAGWWDSDDLAATVRVLIRWSEGFRRRVDRAGAALGPLLDLPARLATPGRLEDRLNIHAHYDLSNEFFELILDETMTYSCAVFDGGAQSLCDAQLEKIDRLCRKLELSPEDHLVEIGSGWGGFAVHAASTYGCRVTTTTISDQQRTYVQKRVGEAQLNHLVTVLGDDWRDLRGKYTKLVSVEMIEAVDWRSHDRFMAACSDLLVADGLAAIQAIVIEDKSFERAKHHHDFVKTMVFPGCCMPSIESISGSLQHGGDLRIVDLEDIGRHYAETLKRWGANLASHGAELEALGVGTSLRRLWALYLAYCEASFAERHLSDVQLLLAKPAWRGRLAHRGA